MYNLTYEIKENGYDILKDGRVWITQYEPYIPNPTLSYKENAIKHIEELNTPAIPNTDIEDKISILGEKQECQAVQISTINTDQTNQDYNIMQSMMGAAEVCEMVIALQEQMNALTPTVQSVFVATLNNLGGESAMVEIYANLVLAGKYTLNPEEAINGVKLVPLVYREQVRLKLDEWAK